jgi:hypothetical protein
MSSYNDYYYFQRRERDCLAEAEAAIDPSIAKLHRDFAKRYGKAAIEIAKRIPVAA